MQHSCHVASLLGCQKKYFRNYKRVKKKQTDVMKHKNLTLNQKHSQNVLNVMPNTLVCSLSLTGNSVSLICTQVRDGLHTFAKIHFQTLMIKIADSILI